MDFLFSTQGVMILLLGAYAAAMWMFLTSAPKVHTVMVSDMAQAKVFYEGQLELPNADVPLHYYYGYDQGLDLQELNPSMLLKDCGISCKKMLSFTSYLERR
jgi:hypothetical protein